MGLIVIALLLVPLAEIFVIIKVGGLIGAIPTITLLLAFSIAGGWLVSREGRNAWERFTETLAAGRVPARETADGALIVLAGALLVAPGFLTDLVGLFLLLPPVRDAARAFAASRIVGGGWRGVAFTTASATGRAARSARDARRSYDVEGTVVEADSGLLER